MLSRLVEALTKRKNAPDISVTGRFDVFVLEECDSVDSLKQREIQLIKERKSLAKLGGYNLSKGGDGRFGVTLSEETKRKIGLGNIGKVMSPEAREKMSIAAKKRCVGKPSPMEGRKHSEESLKKIGEASRNRVIKEETKKKISENNKKRYACPEARKKISDGIKRFYENKRLQNLNNGI